MPFIALARRQGPKTSFGFSFCIGTHYYYRVKALDAAGNASNYAMAEVTTNGPPSSDTQALDAAGNTSGYATTNVLTPSAGLTQYVTNPSMESGAATGWAGYNSTSAVAAVKVTGGSKGGSWALRVTNTGSTTGVTGFMSKAPHWVSSTTAGTTYTGSGWFSGPKGTVLTLRLRECNAAGSSCPALANVSVTLPVSGWVNASVAYKARNTGNALRIAVYGTVPAKSTFLADSLSLTAPGS